MDKKIIMDKKKKDKYNCYSLPLMQFLSNNGITFKMMKTNPTTGKNYYIYDKTEQLDKALTQWAVQNPKKEKSNLGGTRKPTVSIAKPMVNVTKPTVNNTKPMVNKEKH